jgi:hypothetical protein
MHRVFLTSCVVALLLAAVSCKTLGSAKSSGSSNGAAGLGPDEVEFAAPVETPSDNARDDPDAAIVTVSSVDHAVFPYVYGYPIYPEEPESRGIIKLRTENAEGARQSEVEDESGVKLDTEELPKLGCRIEGVRESVVKFVPISLTCELPAPKSLGGAKRPVLGHTAPYAKSDELLKEPAIQRAFLGEFHLESDGFSRGSGTGYFNTAHGLLAFVFANKKLVRFVYYFDPGVKGWQNQELWVKR